MGPAGDDLFQIAGDRAERSLLRINGHDPSGGPAHGRCEESHPGIAVEEDVVSRRAGRFGSKGDQHLGALRVDLEERVGRDTESHAVDLLFKPWPATERVEVVV